MHNKIIDLLKEVNKSYEKRHKEGLYYSIDYKEVYKKHRNHTTLTGKTNSSYWKSLKPFNIFVKHHDKMPSKALTKWLKGPTVTECAGVIQAIYYKYILNTYKEELFDKKFNNPISPFIITNNLFAPMINMSKKIIDDNGHIENIGNPLFFCFELFDSTNIKYEELRHGDIVYIKGIKDYSLKHIDGSAGGWNLICVKEENNEPQFIGFGPKEFKDGPLKYEQLREIFITAYNAEQTLDAKNKIEKYTKNFIPLNNIDENNAYVCRIASTYANAKVKNDVVIIGLEYVLRFDEKKLNNFMMNDIDSWQATEFDILKSKLDENIKKCDSKKNLKSIVPFSSETKEKTFYNYNIDINNDDTIILDMYTLFFKYALFVSSHDFKYPSAFVVQGSPGIGKTHLSVAVTKFVCSHNKQVLFIDSKYIDDKYRENMMKLFGNSENVPSFENMSNVENDTTNIDVFNNIDLIVYDDVNSQYGPTSKFLKNAIEYIYKNNKSILISSNVKLTDIYDYIPDFIGYDNKLTNNFIVKNFNFASFRKSWTDNCIISNIPNNTGLISQMMECESTAGIIYIDQTQLTSYLKLENKRKLMSYVNMELNKLKFMQNMLVACKKSMNLNENTKIKVVNPTFSYNQHINGYYSSIKDFDTKNINDYDIVFCYISDNVDLLHNLFFILVQEIHDYGKKIFIVIDDLDEIRDMITTYLNRNEYDKERLTDRIRVIFPKLIL
jgi:DNA replication protein DnaC